MAVDNTIYLPFRYINFSLPPYIKTNIITSFMAHFVFLSKFFPKRSGEISMIWHCPPTHQIWEEYKICAPLRKQLFK